MLLISCIILIFVVILLNRKPIKNPEQFKNNQSYKPIYLNNPQKMIKYHKKRNLDISTNKNCDRRTIVRPIYHNDDDDEMVQLRKSGDESDKFNKIDYIIPLSLSKQKCFTGSKYTSQTNNHKLYGDALFTFKPAKKIISNDHPTIDQTISSNIINYIEQGIESVPDNHTMNGCKINNMQGKTIKQIYDDITNDNRFEFQQNLDDVEANNARDDYIIGRKYGCTRFDTYSVQA